MLESINGIDIVRDREYCGIVGACFRVYEFPNDIAVFGVKIGGGFIGENN
jgi:hypothetical protein